MKKTELLAPAGDMSCLKAAVAAGADAVYLGGQRFGARAFAGNFSDDELLEALRFAHFFQKKIYLTVNTLTKEEELFELILWLTPFYEAGLDGLIIQDLGVLERCRRAFPDMPLHASTQMTVTESDTALFLKKCGVSRIVPARELSLAELAKLKEETGLELETFIHGALCYSYSGQCLFSSLLGGRSGNRGRCAQPCRLPYTVLQQENDRGQKRNVQSVQYPLSLKDLCVLPFLPRLLEAGIDSFKIEGRMKGPEYVAGVTAMYRKYMDLYERDAAGWRVEEKDLEFLSRLYVRSELSGGYYERHNGREMVTAEKPGYAGTSEEVLNGIREKYPENGLTKTVDMTISLQEQMPARLTAVCGQIRAEGEGMTVMAAQKRPLSREDVEKQLKKTGGSCFSAGAMDIRMGESVFLPVSALNELRRQTLEALFVKMTDRYRRKAQPCSEALDAGFAGDEAAAGKTAVYMSALQAEQALEGVRQSRVLRVYLSAEEVLEKKDLNTLWDAVRERKKEDGDFSFFLTLPVILRAYSEGWFQKLAEFLRTKEGGLVDGLMASSLSGLLWARRLGWMGDISLQHSVYVFNRETWAFLMRHFAPDSYTAPLELNRTELKSLPVQNMEVMVYGRIPMMNSAGCIRKTSGLCRMPGDFESLAKLRPARSSLVLRDRYQAEFPVLINCHFCMNTIYNSVPLSLHQYLDEIKQRHVRAVRLDFTDEPAADCRRLLRFFADGEGMPPAAYTTGHYKKGVQ